MHPIPLAGSFSRTSVREQGLEDGELGDESFGGGRESEREVGGDWRLSDAEVGREDAGHHDTHDSLYARLVLIVREGERVGEYRILTEREGNGPAHLYIQPLLRLVVCEQMQNKVADFLQGSER